MISSGSFAKASSRRAPDVKGRPDPRVEAKPTAEPDLRLRARWRLKVIGYGDGEGNGNGEGGWATLRMIQR